MALVIYTVIVIVSVVAGYEAPKAIAAIKAKYAAKKAAVAAVVTDVKKVV